MALTSEIRGSNPCISNIYSPSTVFKLCRGGRKKNQDKTLHDIKAQNRKGEQGKITFREDNWFEGIHYFFIVRSYNLLNRFVDSSQPTILLPGFESQVQNLPFYWKSVSTKAVSKMPYKFEELKAQESQEILS